MAKDYEPVKCDLCKKPAVVNFQSGVAQYNITDGDYEWDGFEADNSTNEHYCQKHRNEGQ